MRLWSVEHEANSWNDDMFTGTYDECVDYCKEHDYKIDGAECRLAEIELDDKGCVIDTYDIIKDAVENAIEPTTMEAIPSVLQKLQKNKELINTNQPHIEELHNKEKNDPAR